MLFSVLGWLYVMTRTPRCVQPALRYPPRSAGRRALFFDAESRQGLLLVSIIRHDADSVKSFWYTFHHATEAKGTA